MAKFTECLQISLKGSINFELILFVYYIHNSAFVSKSTSEELSSFDSKSTLEELSAFDSKSTSEKVLLVEVCDWLGDGSWSSTSSPKNFAVNPLASKSRSGHSETILLAPCEIQNKS